MIKSLIASGMNVARINLSHAGLDVHKKTIAHIKQARKEMKKPVAIMLDTKGPEVRLGKLSKDPIFVKSKQLLKLVANPKKSHEIPVFPFSALETAQVGMRLLFNDGYIQSKIVEKTKDSITVEIINSGELKSRKKINVPEAYLNLPAITEQDLKDLEFAVDQDIDFIAASFIRSSEHVLEIKNILAKLKNPNIPIIAKIESKEGIENFDAIVEIADGIMVARGDLGVEVDISLVPQYQKMMIRKTHERFKPVVIATQMLESMINNPRPTRAEVSDVANAIYDGTSLVMLSGETATGKYPVETVKQMHDIIQATEKDFDYKGYFLKESSYGYNDVSSSVAIAAVKTAYTANAKAIFIYTSSGITAQLVAHFKPDRPILALTNEEKTYQELSFMWGVIPVYTPHCKNADEAFSILSQWAQKEKILNFGDLVVMTAGVPFGKKGSTNLMRIESIGSISVRGFFGHGIKTIGKVKVLSFPNDKGSCKGKILVISRCDENYTHLFQMAKGVILQNSLADVGSENYAISLANTHNVPLIVRADNAMTLLENDQIIVMDPEKGLVYPEGTEK
jgi:pyruvate kinase